MRNKFFSILEDVGTQSYFIESLIINVGVLLASSFCNYSFKLASLNIGS